LEHSLAGYLFNLFGASGVTGLNVYSLLVAVVGAVGEGIGAAGAEDPNDRSDGRSGDELATLDPLAQRVLDGLPGRAWARPDAISRRCSAATT